MIERARHLPTQALKVLDFPDQWERQWDETTYTRSFNVPPNTSFYKCVKIPAALLWAGLSGRLFRDVGNLMNVPGFKNSDLDYLEIP